jgi:hypothetical protein
MNGWMASLDPRRLDQVDDVHNPYGHLPYLPSGNIPGANEDDSGGHPSSIIPRIIDYALSIVEMTDEEREAEIAGEAHQERSSVFRSSVLGRTRRTSRTPFPSFASTPKH